MSLKRKLAIGAAGVLVLAGTGATYAANRDSGGDRDAFLNDVAKRLGVSRDKLDSALEGAFSDRLDDAVAEGRLSREQADDIEKRAKEHGGVPPFLGPHPDGPHLDFKGQGPLFGGIDAAADYLGLTPSQLRERLMSGISLADLARDRGKSVEGLRDAIESAVRKALDEAVDEERLTDSQRDRILEDLGDVIDRFVDRAPPEPPRLGERPKMPRLGHPPEMRFDMHP